MCPEYEMPYLERAGKRLNGPKLNRLKIHFNPVAASGCSLTLSLRRDLAVDGCGGHDAYQAIRLLAEAHFIAAQCGAPVIVLWIRNGWQNFSGGI
jgi:hypothetical protein